jgi:membrane protein required for colicin V production
MPEFITRLTCALQSMSWIDSLIVATLLLGATIGFFTGFVWQIIKLVSWIASFWVAAHFHIRFTQFLDSFIGIQLPPVASYVSILVVSLLAFHLIAQLAKLAVDAIKLKPGDRILGVFLGIAKSFLICGIITWSIQSYARDDSPTSVELQRSRLGPPASQIARLLWNTAADEISPAEDEDEGE